jgi:PAS domain S-box-containing protein
MLRNSCSAKADGIRIASKITGIYAFIGWVWILFSDRIVSSLTQDLVLLTQLQTYKGWFYVIVTAGILYMLVYKNIVFIRTQEEKVASTKEELEAAYEELIAANEELRQQFDKAHRDNRFLQALHDTTLEIMNRLDSKDLLEAVITRAGQLAKTEHGYIYLVNREKNILELTYSSGYYRKDLGFCLAKGDGLSGRVWESGQTMVIEDLSKWPQRTLQYDHSALRAAIAVPVKQGTEIVGVIGLSHLEEGRCFGEEEVTALTRFAELASIAVDNALLYSRSQLLTRALEAAANAVVITNVEGTIQWVNSAYTSLTGFSRDEAFSQDNLFRFPKYSDDFIADVRQRLYGGSVWQGEILRENRSGRTYLEEITITPVCDDKGTVSKFIAVKQDITVRRQAENEVMEARAMMARTERLASLGAMAAGIAHEINQPLNSLKVTADGMNYWLNRGKDFDRKRLSDSFKKISGQAQRIDNIIKHLRAFVRTEGVVSPEPCNLNGAVEGALRLVGSQIRNHDIEIIRQLADNLPSVRGSIQRLEEVIINLLVNAMHAVNAAAKDNKRIYIKSGYSENNEIVLAIADNGIGITDTIKEKIFDPFFSTKPVGEGMGIGLSIVHSIISSYGGEVSFTNNEEGGATFYVRLQVFDKA